MVRFTHALLAGAVLAAAAPQAASAACPHFAGTWTSDFGPMTLKATPIKGKPDAFVVSGTYVWSGTADRITGTANGKQFTGRWIQSDRWGYLTMLESPDDTGFGGTWTEANRTGGGRWNGNCTKS